jgi:Family of unknown function (DUF6069)
MRRLLTIGLAALAGLTAWFLLAEAAGIDLAARTGPTSTTHVGAGGVAIVAALAGLAAWGLLALLERVSGKRARRIWTVIAVAVLAVSLLGPLGGIGAPAVAGLLCLHLVVGLVLIADLPRSSTA